MQQLKLRTECFALVDTHLPLEVSSFDSYFNQQHIMNSNPNITLSHIIPIHGASHFLVWSLFIHFTFRVRE